MNGFLMDPIIFSSNLQAFFPPVDCKAGNRVISQLWTSFLATKKSYKSFLQIEDYGALQTNKQTNKPTDEQEVLLQHTVWSSEHGVLPAPQLMWGCSLIG